jgi:dienelactone hydrolase
VDRPTAGTRGDGSIGQLAGAEQIYVLPTAWRERPWWSDAQVDNLRIILDRVKRTYNVDEHRVVLSGVSDGGTSAFYMAMRDTTPYASFLPLNGYIMILANPSMRLTDGLFPTNLLNKPFFVVNGGQDPLYPTELVEPYLTHFQKGGVEIDYKPQPQGVHNTAWWPQVKDTFEAFVTAHRRNPLPARLTWETDGNPRTNRAAWLVIDRLRPRRPEVPLADLNQRVIGTAKNFGVRTNGMRLTSVVAGSNAAAIGLLPGDVVTSVNGRDLPEMLNMMELMAIYDPGAELTFRVKRGTETIDLKGTYQPADMPAISTLFSRNPPSGRVDLVRTGNTVRATTRGVAQFTLLLSPDAFDFSQPITVIADDRQLFSGRVTPSVATLMKWAATDNDRTMLFGAELKIEVP